MKQLLNTLLGIPEVKSLVEAVERGECPAAVTGLGSVHRAQVGAAPVSYTHLTLPTNREV